MIRPGAAFLGSTYMAGKFWGQLFGGDGAKVKTAPTPSAARERERERERERRAEADSRRRMSWSSWIRSTSRRHRRRPTC